MTAETISKAVQRVRKVLSRHPNAGIHADEPAIARWGQDLRVICTHANGTQIATDLPAEIGGTGDQVSPGWLMRAGLASCLATRIAMEAAAEGIVLTRLEVSATSTSDARGLFGMRTDVGEPITAGPRELRLEVRIGAPGVPRERLQAMIGESHYRSPVSAALVSAVPVALHIEVDPS
jgi:uncharacterized OsmC-like protein